MLTKNRIAQFLSYAIGALIVWAIVGCGGSGGSSSPAVSLKIAWPPRNTRYIPTYANSITLSLYAEDTAQPPMQIIANRPAENALVQTVEFDGPILAGHYMLTGIAKKGYDGSGDVVANGSKEITVDPVGTTTVSLTLNSTLKSIRLLDTPLTMNKNDVKELSVEVTDYNDNLVLLSNEDLSWALVFGADKVSVNAKGVVTALEVGEAKVIVSEIGAGLYDEGDISVVIPPPPPMKSITKPVKHSK